MSVRDREGVREIDSERGIETGRVGDIDSDIDSEKDSGIHSDTDCVIDGEIACEIERGSTLKSIE